MTPDAESQRGTEHPSSCENPRADCHREPGLMVRWAEDYTADDPNFAGYLCRPCYEMVKKGTRISPNELEGRSITPRSETTDRSDTATDQEGEQR